GLHRFSQGAAAGAYRERKPSAASYLSYVGGTLACLSAASRPIAGCARRSRGAYVGFPPLAFVKQKDKLPNNNSVNHTRTIPTKENCSNRSKFATGPTDSACESDGCCKSRGFNLRGKAV